MKMIKPLFAFAVAGLLFTSCKDNTSTNPPAENHVAETSDAPAGKLETASFSIDGMTCSMGCAKTIEKKLARLDGVHHASVDFENKTAKVEYDASKQTPEKLVETVESVADGETYKVSDVKSSADQAMFYSNKEKEKEKKKKKKSKGNDKESADKKGCSSGSKPAGGCCAKKANAASSEKSTM